MTEAIITNEHLRYPIGKFKVPVTYTAAEMQGWINDIRLLPGKMRQAVIGLTEKPFRHPVPYRRLDHQAGDPPRSR